MYFTSFLAMGSIMISAFALPTNLGSFGLKGAVYFLNDNPAGSSIVAIGVNQQGLLSDSKSTSTRGIGSALVTGSGSPAAQDPLGSQGSVTVFGNFLFTVNAGSNTAVMFIIDPLNPLELIMVGTPVDTLGQLPVSVTYSQHLQMLCVLNGGSLSGVSCFHVDPIFGLRASGGLVPLGEALHQTNPPSGPPNAASEILFTQDSSAVLVVTRGKAGVNPVQPGWVVSYPIVNGRLSSTGTFNAYDRLPMAFGSVYINQTSLLVADPSFGAAIVDVSNPSKPDITSSIAVDTSLAICWSAFDTQLQLGYLMDAGKNTISVVDVHSASVVDAITVNTGSDAADGPGLFDAAVTGNMLYALGGRPGIAVIDLQSGTQVQWQDLSALGNRQGFTGMAVYQGGLNIL